MTPLVPACDRCGTPTSTDFLSFDGVGHVCPECRVGNPEARLP